jgi:hypothetical protein
MTRMRDAIPGYVLEHRLGEGAAGTVWRARQSASMDRPVAVKRVRAEAVAQLEREAAVLTTLDHPHIVRVFEVVADGEGVAIVMELAPGGSLEERLARQGPRPLDEVVDVVTKLAGALASAHRRGVLHGDVKPGNVVFSADGEPLLADFGLGGGDGGCVRGTGGYVDPAVLAGRPPDATSDVYGLAAVARTMLGPGAPLPPAVARALSARPADRFASAEEFAAALVQPVTSGATRAFGPRPPLPPPAAARSPRRLVAAVVVVVIAAEAAALAALHRPERAVAAAAPVACSPLPAPEAGSVLLAGDTDGDGCPNAVVRTGNVLQVDGGDRFALGAEGDVAVLGDWDCDGTATPGLFRPSTGESFVFDRWARADGQALPAAGRATARRCAAPRGHGRG